MIFIFFMKISNIKFIKYINRKNIIYNINKSTLFRYYFKKYQIFLDFIKYLIYILRNFFSSKNINLTPAKISKIIKFYKYFIKM